VIRTFDSVQPKSPPQKFIGKPPTTASRKRHAVSEMQTVENVEEKGDF
jgi:hypothetical protein